MHTEAPEGIPEKEAHPRKLTAKEKRDALCVKNIKSKRRLRARNRNDVAREAKIDPTRLELIELGSANPTAKELNALAKALGCTVKEFYSTKK